MASISNTSATSKMSDRAEVKLTILEAVVMRTLLALVVTILFTLYTVACVQIQLQWSFSSYLSEALAKTL